MITKHKLVLDPTDMSEGDNVGAYLRSSDGTLITHTNVGGKDALDVNVANDVTVTATDLDIRDLAFATDKVDVSGSEVSLDAATLAALESITVSATDLDIRDLAFATDSVDVSGSAVSISGDVNVTQGTSPWVVSATDLDIRDLSHTQDSIKIGDGTDFLAINADGSINVNADISIVNGFEKAEDAAHVSGDIGGYILSVRQDTLSASASDGDYQSFKTDALGRLYSNNAHQTMANAAVLVGTSATDLAGTDLANRKRILVQNRGGKAVFIGKDNTVTTSNGIELPSGSSMELDIGPSVNLHAISTAINQDVRVLELA